MNEKTAENVTGIIVAVLPSVISLIRDAFKQAHPDLPVPTSAEVMATFGKVCTDSLSVDAEYLKTHPKV